MAQFLNKDRVYYVTARGTRTMKRVSAAYEAQFPRKYRQTLTLDGPGRTVKQLMNDQGLTLAEAWEKLKAMCND